MQKAAKSALRGFGESIKKIIDFRASFIRSAWLRRRFLTTFVESGSGKTIKRGHVLAKTLLVMRLTVLFLTAGFFHVSATGVSQNITFSGQNVPLQSVFSSVKKQTGFVFLYSEAVIKSSRPVTIEARSIPLEEFLSTIFKTQPLEYLIEGKSIFISPKSVNGPANHDKPKTQIEFWEVALIDVSGRVVDESGGPVLATVTVKGANRSTVTDDNGYFKLKQVDENAVLVFTGITIEAFEIKVGGRTDLSTINTRRRVDQGKEVVVIGYGTQSKRDLTGAVGQVNSDEIKNLPLVSVEQALQGRISGVKVKHNGGDLKNNFGINIRGVNSTSNGGQPLFVIDGVPLAAGTLSNINPADIATMDVLKDASATAIYGSRAANGVVMITTKTGSGRGKDVVDFTTEAGLLTPVIPFEMADAFLQAEIVKESLTEAQITIPDELNDPNGWRKIITTGRNLQLETETFKNTTLAFQEVPKKRNISFQDFTQEQREYF